LDYPLLLFYFIFTAVLQLCYNKLRGSIPPQLGSLKKLSVLALQYNQLTGAIPATLGDLPNLKRLDLSFNQLFGSIPTKLANAPVLEVLDIRNNSLSGSVSIGNILVLVSTFMLTLLMFESQQTQETLTLFSLFRCFVWMKRSYEEIE